MRITPINVRNNYNFGHKILIDIGASNPKGSCKVRGISEDGREIFKSSGYLNTTVKGFRMKKDEETGKRDNGQADFITKLDDVIYNAHRRILAREPKRRKNIINADLVECIVAMPTQLFYTTQIPVSLWFLSKNKKTTTLKQKTWQKKIKMLKYNCYKTEVKGWKIS